MTRKHILLCIVAVLAVVALCFNAGQTLLFGWVGYLLRELPGVNPDLKTVAVSIAAIMAFAVGVHWLGRAFANRKPDGPRWTIRGTIAATALIFVMFMSAVSIVGVVHMSLWLATSPEPMLVPSIREKVGGRMNSSNNMKQFGLGFHNYHDTYQILPAAGTFSQDGRALHGWEIQLGPFVGWSSREIDMDLPWDHPRNAEFFRGTTSEFINPSLGSAPVYDDLGNALIHYSANSHVFRANKSLAFGDIHDGISNTIFMGEINANFPPWGKPMNVRDPAKGINTSPYGFGGPRYAGGQQFLMGDGRVRFIGENVSPEVMRALATPAGGERVDLP